MRRMPNGDAVSLTRPVIATDAATPSGPFCWQAFLGFWFRPDRWLKRQLQGLQFIFCNEGHPAGGFLKLEFVAALHEDRKPFLYRAASNRLANAKMWAYPETQRP